MGQAALRQRHRRRRRLAGTALVWAGAVAFGTAYGSGALDRWLPASGLPTIFRPPADHTPTVDGHGPADAAATADGPGIRASFGRCKWGGGQFCVVDGDTIYLGGSKVRIADIDAPETHDYGCPSELALGNRATDRLGALLNSGRVTLRPIDRDRDVYGRLLRRVEVDGRDVGDTLVSEGLARPYAGGRKPWC